MKSIIASLPGRLVRRHLDRLRTSLDTLGERLREAVSRVVGEAVSEAVREAVHVLINLPTTTAPAEHPPESCRQEWEPRQWHDPYRRPWDDEDEELSPADDDDVAPAARRDELPVPARWARAVGVGCQAAAWWLRRQTSRFPMFITLSLGVTTALTAYAAGPAVVAGGAGVLGAALGLVRLAESIASGTAVLRS